MSEWSKKREIMQSYDCSAPVYEAQYVEEQNAKMKVAVANVKVSEDSLVLDAGCGTGLLFEYVGSSVKLLVGLDISGGVLKRAKKPAKKLRKVALVRADADLTPFRNNVFDAVFAITLLQNMPDPTLTLLEMKRISKQHAIIVITGLKKTFSLNSFLRLIEEAGVQVSSITMDNRLKSYVAIIEMECF